MRYSFKNDADTEGDITTQGGSTIHVKFAEGLVQRSLLHIQYHKKALEDTAVQACILENMNHIEIM